MKNPPTLADAFVAFSLRPGIRPDLAKICRAMLPARKFVLDDTMGRYWADAEMGMMYTRAGSYRKRIAALNNSRILSRLPHIETWIEHDPRPYRNRTIEKYGLVLKPGIQTAVRRGWLLQQHPQLDTVFKCTEYTAHKDMDDLHINSFAMAWTVDDSTLIPWRAADFPEDWRNASLEGETSSLLKNPTGVDSNPAPDGYCWSDSELLAGMTGYIIDQVKLIESAGPELRFVLSKHSSHYREPRSVWKMRAMARAVWMLLSLINDLPVEIENVAPSRGYVARGNYKKFLEHSIVHLTVPETRWRKLIAKTAAMLRRRAHQVRGHWRKDWRHPLSPMCDHVFDDTLICRRCQGRKLWIAEHQRGDTSIGFVTHDYVVKHEVSP